MADIELEDSWDEICENITACSPMDQDAEEVERLALVLKIITTKTLSDDVCCNGNHAIWQALNVVLFVCRHSSTGLDEAACEKFEELMARTKTNVLGLLKSQSDQAPVPAPQA